ncbi:hypothetical protein Ahy_A05g022041 isoform L [Arachis hypogaea]|uniref:Uncharacterized protein n=1 Tax=Arachis hypogaea TaxID=3818 RepID=A0A445CZG1_ARAHY|nr:hypothetical protein Ahy_A05g022041 isoform L [Arachis hypogaea]
MEAFQTVVPGRRVVDDETWWHLNFYACLFNIISVLNTLMRIFIFIGKAIVAAAPLLRSLITTTEFIHFQASNLKGNT